MKYAHMIGTNNGVMKFTQEGGFAVRLINATGSATVHGSLVKASNTVANAVNLVAGADFDPIGAIYGSGVANGQYCWVVIGGICDVLIKDSTAVNLEDFVQVSDTTGRAFSPGAIPDGQSFAAVNNHFREIGHSLQAVSAGTGKTCRILMHFN